MKIIIADASPLYRLGISITLKNAGIKADTLSVTSLHELQLVLSELRGFVVVIIDSRLPGLECVDELTIARERPDTGVLMLTDHEPPVFARRTPLHAVVVKTTALDELGSAIGTVCSGRTWRPCNDPGEGRQIRNKVAIGPALSLLSGQEANVLRLVRKGLRNKQIALNMSLTEHTIKTHMSNILRKLKVENRTQLVIALQKVERNQAAHLRSGVVF
ncbi:MAG: LuxR C-terminal-related transcriptional regulator [Pontibacterium sp.]